MNTREYFAKRLAEEKPTFLRVMRAVPEDRLDYRPHERSMTAGQIVWLLASELDDASVVARTGEVDYKMPPAPATLAEMLAKYESAAGELAGCVAGLDDATWDGPARFKMNGSVVWETTVGEMLWGILFDAVHHRGQLSTYLRPMGAKVPSIYGPSADDPGGA